MPCEKDVTESMVEKQEEQLKLSADLSTKSNSAADAPTGIPSKLILPKTLQAGQKLPGTIWRMKHPSEIFKDIKKSSLRTSLEKCLEGRVEESSNIKAQAEGFDSARSYNLPRVELQELDLKRWIMASEAPRFKSEKKESESGHFGSIYETTLVRKCEEWPWREAHRSTKPLFRLGVSVAGVIYGGLHTLAWSATFDSDYQRLLWRISSCVVMGEYPALIVINLLRKTCGNFSEILANLMVGVIGTFYVLARGYLVVECFINLFNLPIGVYKVPRWTAYVPHIS